MLMLVKRACFRASMTWAKAPNGMLAYIERENGGVEVLLLRPGSAETLHTDCLAAALSLISARCAARSGMMSQALTNST